MIMIQMIRRIRLIDRVAAWSPPDLTDVSGLDKAWKAWAQYETIKRLAKYVDSTHLDFTHSFLGRFSFHTCMIAAIVCISPYRHRFDPAS
jgi:hypothetical protein